MRQGLTCFLSQKKKKNQRKKTKLSQRSKASASYVRMCECSPAPQLIIAWISSIIQIRPNWKSTKSRFRVCVHTFCLYKRRIRPPWITVISENTMLRCEMSAVVERTAKAWMPQVVKSAPPNPGRSTICHSSLQTGEHMHPHPRIIASMLAHPCIWAMLFCTSVGPLSWGGLGNNIKYPHHIIRLQGFHWTRGGVDALSVPGTAWWTQ